MKALIILLGTIAICSATPEHYVYHGPPAPLGHDGRVIDTPEVEHAKAEHFARFAKEAARNSHGYGYGYAPDSGYGGHVAHYAPEPKWHGPPAPLGHDGRVVDTPEVAHAKAAHLSILAHETAKAPAGHGYEDVHEYSPAYSHHKYPPAPIGHDGRVVDTPEVAHAKANHLAAYHAASYGAHH